MLEGRSKCREKINKEKKRTSSGVVRFLLAKPGINHENDTIDREREKREKRRGEKREEKREEKKGKERDRG